MAAYRRTLFNPWCLPIWLAVVGLLTYAFGWLRLDPDSSAAVPFQLGAVALCVAALSVSYLRVADDGDRLRVKCGPIPVFGASLPYEFIDYVEPMTLNPLLPGPLGVPGMWSAFGSGIGSGVRIHMKRRGQWWPLAVYASAYDVACREPDVLVEAVCASMEEPGPLFVHDRERHVGFLLPALAALGLDWMAGAVTGSSGPSLVVLSALGLWAFQGRWLVAGYKVLCLEDEVFIRYCRYGRLRIPYESIRSVTDPASAPAVRGPRSGPMRIGRSGHIVRIEMEPTSRLLRALSKVRTVDLAVDDPERLKAILREKMAQAGQASSSA